MRSSRLAVYRSDGEGRLRLVRNYIRYTWERPPVKSRPTRQLVGFDAHVVKSYIDRPSHSLSETVARIEERIRRLRRYPQYYHDSEVHLLEQLLCALRDLVEQMA